MMAKKEKEYLRLPGRGLASEGVVAAARVMSRLYLGKDHLLRVNSGWVETYRRFFFTDIQAIIVSRTYRRLVWSMILGALCAGLLFWFLAIHSLSGRITLACFFGIFALVLGINVLYGPTCRVRILTNLGSEPLPSLRRISTARKVIAALKPEIRAAQGELEAADIPQKFAELQASPSRERKTRFSKRPNLYRGGVHIWLFAALLSEAGLMTLFYLNRSSIAGLCLLLSAFCVAGLTFVALARQSGSTLGDGLKSVTWCALAQVVLTLAAGYVLMVFTIATNPTIGGDQVALAAAMAKMAALNTSWGIGLYAFLGGVALLLAVAGLILWLDSRAATASQTPAAATPP